MEQKGGGEGEQPSLWVAVVSVWMRGRRTADVGERGLQLQLSEVFELLAGGAHYI